MHVYENQEDEESEVNIDDDEDTVPSQVSDDDELLAIEGGENDELLQIEDGNVDGDNDGDDDRSESSLVEDEDINNDNIESQNSNEKENDIADTPSQDDGVGTVNEIEEEHKFDESVNPDNDDINDSETQKSSQTTSGGYNLRSKNKKPEYSFRLVNQMNETDSKVSYIPPKAKKSKKEKKKNYNTTAVQFMQVNTVTETSSTNGNIESVRDYSIPFIESALLKADEDPKDLMSFVTH